MAQNDILKGHIDCIVAVDHLGGDDTQGYGSFLICDDGIEMECAFADNFGVVGELG